MTRSQQTWLAAALIALAVFVAYANSLHTPWVFDDHAAIEDNVTIRHLGALRTVLSPPHGGGTTVEGRPVLNLSFAINYAWGGTHVEGYHVVNVLIHLLAALTLWGLLRRTPVEATASSLQRPRTAAQRPGDRASRRRHGDEATRPSLLRAQAWPLAGALIWALHPLQTESVTYVSQRAESLMGLFYLLTLYCFIRSTSEALLWPGSLTPAAGAPDASAAHPSRQRPWLGRTISVVTRSPALLWPGAVTPAAGPNGHSLTPVSSRRPWLWLTLSALSCWLGMATKEVMISAPLVVLLFDRTFLSGTFRAALRQRRAYYLALFASAAVLALFAWSHGTRGGMSGFGISVRPTAYWATQFQAIAHYLALCFWPHAQIFDYGAVWAHGVGDILPSAILIVALAVATAILLWRNRPAGFLGAAFFAILAPTSVIPGNRQTLAEHRMYLPLAAVVIATLWLAQKFGRRVWLPAAAIGALALAAATVHRNAVYRTELTLFQDTVAHRPQNASAHDVLANRLRDAGRMDEALAQYREAIRLRPEDFEAEYNLGLALAATGRPAEAIAHYEAALRINPDYPDAHNNLGIALARGGQGADAERHLRRAVQLQPAYVEAHYNLAVVLAQAGRYPEAVAELREALRLNPAFGPAHHLLRMLGQPE